MRKQHIHLPDADRLFLQDLLKKGSLKAIIFKRATALLQLHSGSTLILVARTLGVTYRSVASWRDNYKAHGLASIRDKPRPGRPPIIDGAQRAKVTALACSKPPLGRSRWTLRLLSDRAVELGYCRQLSHTSARYILKKTNCGLTSTRVGA